MRTRILTAIGGLAVATALAGCGSAASTHVTTTVTPAALSCAQQVSNWKPTGIADTQAVGNALSAVASDLHSAGAALATGGAQAAMAQVASDSTTLSGAASTALGSPPPSCVPGARAPYEAAMRSLLPVGQDATASALAYDGGDIATATADIDKIDTALTVTSADVSLATSAVNAYNR